MLLCRAPQDRIGHLGLRRYSYRPALNATIEAARAGKKCAVRATLFSPRRCRAAWRESIPPVPDSQVLPDQDDAEAHQILVQCLHYLFRGSGIST
jgi:hypothetical protein